MKELKRKKRKKTNIKKNKQRQNNTNNKTSKEKFVTVTPNKTFETKTEEKQKKYKIEKILIIINCLILAIIILFYGYRFIKYYKIDHEIIEEKSSIYDTITIEKNIVTIGDGLYKNENDYTYIGKKVDNYVYYSGRMWRIISIDEANCTLITEDSQTILAFGKDGNYETSYIRSWLNKTNDPNTGIFYDSLNAPDVYLNKSEWCIDEVTNNEYSCNKKVEDYIGLITINENYKSGGKNSYLNNNYYYWTINSNKNKAWYVLDTGDINNNAYIGNNYYNYGVRPVIKLKSEVIIYSGNGTKENPYIIENTNYDNLINAKSGQYIKYNDNTYRIISNSDDNIKIMSTDYVKENNEYKLLKYIDIEEYLNNIDIKIDKNKIIKSNFYNGNYKMSYLESYKSSKILNVGIPSIGDLFISDYKDYYLMNKIDNNLTYSVLNEGQLFLDETEKKIIFTLNMKNDLVIINGNGTKESPYVVR